jgi:Fe-S-cluster containining protein
VVDESADPAPELPAGGFASWLSGMERALRHGATSAVPCGTCTACCTSSQFVHIAPDETATLARVPRALRFAAPGLPEGHVVVGYDEHGHCPLLVDGRCSIYDDRPRTCRTYDCRIFAAAGVVPEHAHVARRSNRWRFTFAGDDDRLRHEAVRAASAYLHVHREQLGDAAAAPNPTQLAVLAVEIHDLFLGRGPGPGPARVAAPAPEVVAARLTERTHSAPS